MKNIKKHLLRHIANKENGDGAIIAGLVVMMTLLLVMAFSLSMMKDYNCKASLDDTIRTYALVAETQGGLTAAQVVNMQTEIAVIMDVDPADVMVQVKNSGGTILVGTQQVRYGEGLVIDVRILNHKKEVSEKLAYIMGGTASAKEIHIKKVCTSKY